MQRMKHYVLTLAMVAGAAACAEWSNPAAFDAERQTLQDEWESACGDACSEGDAPAACGIVGDARSCSGYNEANAMACIDLYKKVIQRNVCSASDKDMINLGSVCNAVYVECGGETDTGEASTDTDGGADTDGEIDTGGTE